MNLHWNFIRRMFLESEEIRDLVEAIEREEDNTRIKGFEVVCKGGISSGCAGRVSSLALSCYFTVQV